MKKFLIAWPIAALVMLAISWVGVKADTVFHPWLPTVIQDWKWYNYLTSEHSPTVLYMVHPYVWVGIIVWVAAFAGGFIARDTQ